MLLTCSVMSSEGHLTYSSPWLKRNLHIWNHILSIHLEFSAERYILSCVNVNVSIYTPISLQIPQSVHLHNWYWKSLLHNLISTERIQYTCHTTTRQLKSLRHNFCFHSVKYPTLLIRERMHVMRSLLHTPIHDQPFEVDRFLSWVL